MNQVLLGYLSVKKSKMKKLMLSGIIAVVAFFIVSCSKDDGNIPKKTFVLVHGAWQAAWVWQDVKTQLESRGQKVIVVELPAHGADTTSPLNVSIDLYRDKVIAAITKINGKIILVGHSMGGVVITAVAEKIPKQIEKLVYIGAFLPANGQSLLDLASTDAQSHLGPALRPADGGLTLDIVTDSIINIFCQDGSAQTKQLVLDKFKKEPAIPFQNKVTLTAAAFGSVDKYYIKTLQDHAVGPDLQSRMITAAGITKVYSIQSGHCPFLTMPDAVTKILLGIIKY
ncbi:alpha/beta hydrolase [soil metagenome]